MIIPLEPLSLAPHGFPERNDQGNPAPNSDLFVLKLGFLAPDLGEKSSEHGERTKTHGDFT